VRVVTLDELPVELEAARHALAHGAFSGALSREALAVYRRHDFELSDYVALFGVERGRLLGQVFVLRFPYRTRAGVEPVAGIAGVTTAVGAARRGVARRLLEEVHRREGAAGVRFALLWTSPSWHAHHLYERLGYRDVFVPPLAVRLAGPAHLPAGPRLEHVTAADLPLLERLHREQAAGRTGFSDRPAAFLRVEREAGGLELASLRLLRRGGRPVGYALVQRRSHQLVCGELVARAGAAGALLRAVERESAGRTLVLGNTPVLDLAPELARRGYFVRPAAEWRSLMACRLGGARAAGGLAAELTTDARSFLCLGLDRF